MQPEKNAYTISQIILSIFTFCLFLLTPPEASAELKLESVYPTLGILNQNLPVTLTGTGFDEKTRIFMFPDVGNRRSFIGSANTEKEAYGLTIEDGKAYMAAGESGFLIFDITNPGSPSLISATAIPGEALDVAVAGDKAYIAAGKMGVQIIDLSKLDKPMISGAVETPGTAQGIAVKENIVLVADGEKGVQVINMSDASVVPVDMLSGAYDIAVKGDVAYVADYYSGLQIIDIGNPAAPPVGVENLNTKAYSVSVVGDIAYIADHFDGLHIIDIHDPSAPKEIGAIDAGDNRYSSIAVTGTTAFMGGDMGLHLIDVSDPEAPKLKGMTETSEAVNDVMVTAETAYLAGRDGLNILDVSRTVTVPGVWDTPGEAYGVVVAGDTAYVADGDGGVRIIDVSTPSAPKHIGSKETPGFAYSLAVDGKTVYVADGESGLQIISIDTSSNPVVTGSVAIPGGYAQDVSVAGGHAYIAAGSKGLQVINLNTLEIIGSADTESLGIAYGVAVDGDTAYLAAGISGLQMIDITTPSSPLSLGSFAIPGIAFDITLVGKTAYVAARGGGVQIVDVSTPSDPKIVGSATGDAASEVSVVAGMAYVANETEGIQVFDVTVPSAPVFIGLLDTSGTANGLAVVGDTAYVANGKRGLLAVPVPVELDPVILNENTISLTLPGPRFSISDTSQIFHYTLRVFNENDASEIPGTVSFVPEDSGILKAKAIIVAGRKGDSDKIWGETQMVANHAYKMLRVQGYSDDRIYYLNAKTDHLDVMNDESNDVDALATSGELERIMNDLIREDPPPSELLIFFVGHGEDSVFEINTGDKIDTEMLKGWLDELQKNITGPVIFVYDACQSGTFLHPLAASASENRIVITSGSNEAVWFVNDGQDSFSFQFWAAVSSDANLNNAFNRAKTQMKTYQTAQLDADGNGIPDEREDKDIANDIIIGRGRITDSDISLIKKVAEPQILSGETRATLWASDLTLREDYVQGVWAVIIPPDYGTDSQTEFDEVALTDPDNDGKYEGIYEGFVSKGTYAIDIYIKPTDEMRETRFSLSSQTTVTQTEGNETSEPDAYEEDDTFSQASVIVINDEMPQHHHFHDAGDEDWVRFYGFPEETYKVKASSVSTICDVVIEIYDTNGISLLEAEDRRSAGKEESLDWTCQKESVFYVRVRNFDPNIFGENVRYDLEVYKPSAVTDVTGWIEGFVKDAYSGELISDALIRAENVYSYPYHCEVNYSEWNGEYMISVSPETFDVTAEATGYQPVTYYGVDVNNNETVFQDFYLETDPAPWDLNKDGIVNLDDLYSLLGHWLSECDNDNWEPRYNLWQQDCMINFLDLRILVDHWFERTSRSRQGSDSVSPQGCALDMEYATHDYDAEISCKDIDSTAEAEKNTEIWAAVVAQNVTNLDTYQVLVTFDPTRMAFIEGSEDAPNGNPGNLLKTNGGDPLGFQAVEQIPGTVNIANALKGMNTGESPDGSGIIALLKFKVLDNAFNNRLKLHDVNYLDSDGINRSADSLADVLVNPIPCDDDLTGTVSLRDAILILQILAGMDPDAVIPDIKGDGSIGMADAICILRALICQNL